MARTKKDAEVDIFGVDFVEPTFNKKPTLAQYQKERGEDDALDSFRVETIWYPGNWDNYTIETTHFRVNVASDSPLFPAIDKLCPRLRERDNSIVLVLKDRVSRAFRFAEGGEYGKWEAVGNAGVRFRASE